MAIEDAVGIATILPLGARPEDVPARPLSPKAMS